ncbi:MAG TPA: hypothetical protein VFP39_17865 [Gemmatimonadales bacterium]|nr:hypothetical protein [Gemmatimonadales bacterium]
MALATAPPHATSVSVNLVRPSSVLVAAVAALGSTFGAQRSVLPFGLKAGHHEVRVETALWTPRDSGRYPVVILAAGGPAALEQPFPEYLASHGYTVVRAPGTSAARVAQQYGDSTAVAILTWETDTNAVATVERAAARLSIRVVRGSDLRAGGGRLRVVLPASQSRSGAEARGYRTLCAVTQAILNATLEAAHPTLSQLAARLKAAGVREAYIRAS